MADANSEAIEAWNTVLFDKFVRFRHLVTKGLGAHGETVMARHPPRAGARVLDIGCGFGDMTAELARRVGAGGEALGVDCAPRFIESATREARDAGLGNARFEIRDVQFDPLGGPFDQAYSRFGTMFFNNPVAALRNVRQSLKPGGDLAMVVWRRKDENPWVYLAEQRVKAIVPPEPENHNQPTCGPGPFSMAGPDMVSDQMRAAGFRQIRFERVDSDICIGRTIDEAIEFGMALGPAGEALRLLGDAAEAFRPQVVAALKEAFAPYAKKDGVMAPSSTWIVSAEA